MTGTRFRAVRGTRDILPDEVGRWRRVERTARDVFERWGFREIRTPVFEATELFARSVGETTDIVRKEMYTIETGSESLTLRPENTAAVVRAFVEHDLHRTLGAGFPGRYFYLGPMFRYERPQKGRQRQFHQLGIEVLGAAEPLVDAEVIDMVRALLEALGIPAFELRINSVGDATCRPRFREMLREWLEPRVDRLCEDCRRRFDDNPLRVLDCKVEEDRRCLADAPTILDALCDGCSDHFEAVRSHLEAYGVDYVVDRRIVRGLDYYERTVFEAVAKGLGAQNAVLGGGRYDGLVEELGGPAVPGIGFAAGIERLLLAVPDSRESEGDLDVFLVAVGPEGWREVPGLARRLREAGARVVHAVAERPLGAQMKRADRSGSPFALFVGGDELRDGKLGLKDLRQGGQESLSEADATARILARASGRRRDP